MPRLLSFVLVVALAACASPSPSSSESEGGEEGVAEADLTSTPEQRAQALVAVLKEPGAIKMPAVGVEHHANEMSVTAEVVPLAASLEKMLDARLGDSIEYYGGTPSGGMMSMTANPDTHFSIQFGFEDAAIKTALKELVSDAKRRSVAARLPRLVGTYARLAVYNAGAEVIGDDIILLQPYDLPSKVIVVHVGFVHS